MQIEHQNLKKMEHPTEKRSKQRKTKQKLSWIRAASNKNNETIQRKKNTLIE